MHIVFASEENEKCLEVIRMANDPEACHVNVIVRGDRFWVCINGVSVVRIKGATKITKDWKDQVK